MLKVMKDKYARVFSGADGEEVFKDLMLACGVDRDNFSVDPYQNAKNCGMRTIGLHIKAMITESPKEKKQEQAKR